MTTGPTEARREALRRELDESYSAFRRLVRSLTPQDLMRPTRNAGWSVIDVIAHLASAEAGLAVTTEKFIAGEPTVAEDFDLDRYNNRQVEKRRGRNLHDLLAELDEGRSMTVASLKSATAEDLGKQNRQAAHGVISLDRLFAVVADHMRIHTEDIRLALEH